MVRGDQRRKPKLLPEVCKAARILAYENDDVFITHRYLVPRKNYSKVLGEIIGTEGIWTRYDVIDDLKRTGGKNLTDKQIDHLRDLELNP